MKATATLHADAAAARVAMEAEARHPVKEAGGDESDGEFEFSFVSREPEGAASAADDLFADGRIRAFYPVFGRAFDDAHAAAATERRRPLGRLFLEEARNSSVGSTSSSSSSATTDGGDLDGASPDSYCLWTPGSASAASSPARAPRKSGSTGSIARWRRLGDLVVGRSRSDGKEKFHFLSAPPSPAREPKGAKPRKSAAATEVDTIAAGRRMSSYAPKSPTGATHRTFLPYRQDLMGLFSSANGLTRSPHRTF